MSSSTSSVSPSSVLCAFNNETISSAAAASTGSSLALLSPDNRLRIFDCLSGALRGGRDYAEPHHLAAEYTCIAFSSSIGSGKSKKGSTASSGSGSSNKLGVVALGRSDGIIVIWNLQTGDHIRLGEGGAGHKGRVTDVTFNDAGTVLYSSGVDKQLNEWNASTGKLERARPFRADDNDDNTSITYKLSIASNATSLLAAGTNMTLWDLTTRTQSLTFLGHASPVTCIAWTPDGRYFASACGGDRPYVSLWSVGDDGARRSRASVHTFTGLDSRPISLHFNPSISTDSKSKSSTTYHLSATCDNSTIHIWQWSPSSSSSSSSSTKSTDSKSAATSVANCRISPPATVAAAAVSSGNTRVATEKRGKYKGASASSSLALLDGAVLRSRFTSRNALCIVRHSSVKPVFQQMTYLSESDGSFIPSVTLAAVSATGLIDTSNESKKRKGGDAHVAVSAALDGGLARPISGLEAGGTKRARTDVVSTKTLAERIAEAEAAMSRAGNNAQMISNTQQLMMPKAGSLQVILTQALHSNDDGQLEHVLVAGRSNTVMVKKTVERLPTPYVLPLLRKLIDKFQTKPSRGLYLVTWIRETLNTHTSYLMSVPDLLSSLSQLYSTVDTRLAVFKKLLMLSGRLDLLLSQVNRSVVPTQSSATPVSLEPIRVFNEHGGIESGIDVPRIAAALGSDDEDDNDDDEANGLLADDDELDEGSDVDESALMAELMAEEKEEEETERRRSASNAAAEAKAAAIGSAKGGKKPKAAAKSVSSDDDDAPPPKRAAAKKAAAASKSAGSDDDDDDEDDVNDASFTTNDGDASAASDDDDDDTISNAGTMDGEGDDDSEDDEAIFAAALAASKKKSADNGVAAPATATATPKKAAAATPKAKAKASGKK